MPTTTVTIAMNGVTGRMGRNQHLERSILAIREQGGVALPDGAIIWPEPVLVGRDEARLAALAKEAGLDRYSTDLDAVLADPGVDVYFDATATSARPTGVGAAINAGKAVYCEKPLATFSAAAAELAKLADAAGVKNGMVTDKLYLPGLRKLDRAVRSGFFGRLLSVRCDFGYWVFEGHVEPGQRPSWNYRAEDGGGMVLDMYPHWPRRTRPRCAARAGAAAPHAVQRAIRAVHARPGAGVGRAVPRGGGGCGRRRVPRVVGPCRGSEHRGRRGRIAGFHVCDQQVPLTDVLLSRELPGDGPIDHRHLRRVWRRRATTARSRLRSSMPRSGLARASRSYER